MTDPGTEPQEQTRFSIWLTGRMRHLRLSQKGLAERVAVSQPLISKWVNGTVVPSRETAERLAEALDAPINEVLIQAGLVQREIRLGPSARHTHLHDLIDEMPEGMLDPMIAMVEAIIREAR